MSAPPTVFMGHGILYLTIAELLQYRHNLPTFSMKSGKKTGRKRGGRE